MIVDRILRSIGRIGVCILGLVGLVVLVPSALAAGPNHAMSPLLRLGSQEAAVQVSAGGSAPNYLLRTCQVIGFPGVSGQCYDPYQMRHAYQIDSLINAGYDGRGHTIVIIDAFQSPNIVQQQNFFNTYYGLPNLNGLGNPADPTLETFTQVAPDGLTPFIVAAGQPGWAEIHLDVCRHMQLLPVRISRWYWQKSNQDPDVGALCSTRSICLGDVISTSARKGSCMDRTFLAQHAAFASATQKAPPCLPHRRIRERR